VGAAVERQPLPWTHFPWLAATLLSYGVLTQCMQIWYRRRFDTWL
jgi:Mg2+-importing ATPase